MLESLHVVSLALLEGLRGGQWYHGVCEASPHESVTSLGSFAEQGGGERGKVKHYT